MQGIGIHKYKDSNQFYPNRYIDRIRYYKVNELQNNVAEARIIGGINKCRWSSAKAENG
jgi:ATP-dependent DNA helicase RecG